VATLKGAGREAVRGAFDCVDGSDYCSSVSSLYASSFSIDALTTSPEVASLYRDRQATHTFPASAQSAVTSAVSNASEQNRETFSHFLRRNGRPTQERDVTAHNPSNLAS
jgi:hypothetical protein